RAHFRLADRSRDGKLHHDAVDARLEVQRLHEAQQVRLTRRLRQAMHPADHADFLRRFLLVAHVDSRGRIVTDENHVEPRRAPLGLAKCFDFFRNFRANAGRYRLTVQDECHGSRLYTTERGAGRSERPSSTQSTAASKSVTAPAATGTSNEAETAPLRITFAIEPGKDEAGTSAAKNIPSPEVCSPNSVQLPKVRYMMTRAS